MTSSDESTTFCARSATVVCDERDVIAIDANGHCRMWSVTNGRATQTVEFKGATYALGSTRYWPTWTASGARRVVLCGAGGIECWDTSGSRVASFRPPEPAWGIVRCGEWIFLGLQSGLLMALDLELRSQDSWSTDLPNLRLRTVDDRSFLACSKDTVEWRQCDGTRLARMSVPETVNGACAYAGCILVSNWDDELHATDRGGTRTRRVGDGYACGATSFGLWSTSLVRPETGELALWREREGSLVRTGAIQLPLEPRGPPRAHIQELPGGLHVFPTQRGLTLVRVVDSGGVVEVTHRLLGTDIALVARGPDHSLLLLTEEGNLELIESSVFGAAD